MGVTVLTSAVISQSEDKAIGELRYFTGKLCKRGHISERQTSNGTCLACANESRAERNRANPQPNRERVKAWHAANPDKRLIQAQKFRARHAEKRRAEGIAYAKSHPEVFRRNCALRSARKLQATPKWVDLGAIALVYSECVRVSRETGIQHHVDHIIPLRGKNARGLHVPWNLQILTATENRRKSCRMPPEYSEEACRNRTQLI